MPRYSVVCGNIGTVYDGPSPVDALKTFNEYVEQSKNLPGCRAYGETVTEFRDWEVIREHQGHMPKDDDV